MGLGGCELSQFRVENGRFGLEMASGAGVGILCRQPSRCGAERGGTSFSPFTLSCSWFFSSGLILVISLLSQNIFIFNYYKTYLT